MQRRQLLRRGAAFFSVIAAGPLITACGGGNGNGNAGQGPGSGDSGPPLGTHVFGLGVASGDPRADSVVLWTRVERSNPGNNGDIPLRLQVSTSADFATLLVNENLVATQVYDHTVRAKITGLQPDTRYHYRFVAGRDISASGLTKTAPAANSTREQLRFAWFNCQDWSVNHWGALELLAAEEDLDFTVHVGDYIYETVGAAFQAGQVESAHTPIKLPNGMPLADGSVAALTLDDYRTLYRTYRSDKRLQEVHRKFPFIAVWDDHEFSDDCWQDHQTYNNANLQQTDRRRAANQAWFEYMPVDMGDVSFDLKNQRYDNIRIYRDFQFGPLMHLVMTDQRLYRDDHAIPEALVATSQGAAPEDAVKMDTSVGARYFTPLPTLLTAQSIDLVTQQPRAAAPSILGKTQTQWWKDTMRQSQSTWKVWGNELSLSRMWADLRQNPMVTDPALKQLFAINADCWDGYPAHRVELMQFLTQNNIRNVVAVTGDLHAFQCGIVRDQIGFDPRQPEAPVNPPAGNPAMVDFVAAGVSSHSFFSYLQNAAKAMPALGALVADQTTFEAFMWRGIPAGAHPAFPQGMPPNNPDMLFGDHHAQGYASATITARQMEVRFHKVRPLENGQTPAKPLLGTTRITLAAGSTTPVIG